MPQEDKPNPAQKVTLYTEGAADREGKRKNAETEQHHERHGPAPPAPQEEQEETKKQGAVLYRQKEEVDREVGGGTGRLAGSFNDQEGWSEAHSCNGLGKFSHTRGERAREG